MSRWTTLDRIVELDPQKGALALRNIPATLQIFDTHFPRMPVLPGVLILGSLAELATRLLQERTGKRWRLGRAEQVRFRQFVQPGDQIALAIELKSFAPEAAVFTATVKVDGKLVSSARVLHMVPQEARA